MKPAAIYIHGLGSGADSTTIRQVRTAIPQFDWIAVEVAEDSEQAIATIERYVAAYRPAVVMGTSLGGFYAMYVNAPDAIKIICNPAINIDTIIRDKIGFGEHRYFIGRQDNRQTFTLDELVCTRFVDFRRKHTSIAGRKNYALFSAHDELIGDTASLDNMAMAFEAGYTILIDSKGGHRLRRPALRIVCRVLEGL